MPETIMLTDSERAALDFSVGLSLELAQDKFMRDLCSAVVKSMGGNQSKAARRLGVHRNTIARWCPGTPRKRRVQVG